MLFAGCEVPMRGVLLGSVVALTASLTSGTASAQDKVYTMKIGIPTINNASHQFAKTSPPRSNVIPAAASNPRSFRRANWAQSRG